MEKLSHEHPLHHFYVNISSYISMTSGTRKWNLFCHYRALLHTRKSSKSHYPPFVRESSESEWGGQRILTPHLTRMLWWKDTLSSRVRTCDKDTWMDVQNQWPTAHPGERNIFILDGRTCLSIVLIKYIKFSSNGNCFAIYVLQYQLI